MANRCQVEFCLQSIASNYYHLVGRAGDWCLVLWDEDNDDWAIAQVAHNEIEVPIKHRYYDGYLQAKHRKIAVMYCEDETDWRNKIKLEEAEFVDGVRFTGCDSRVCANVETKVDCVCSCSCNCNCGDSGGGGYPSSGGDSGGGGSGSCSCSCTCTCKAKSVITFG